ncbi:MAG: SAM-dependent methyltransferase, partial [Rhodomicrobium sp.]
MTEDLIASHELREKTPSPCPSPARGEGTPSQRAGPAHSPHPHADAGASGRKHAEACLPGEGQGEEDLAIEDGAILEVRPGVADMLQDFERRAASAPFAALIADYGYSRPSFGDTVQAVRQHRFAGLFEAPGEADMTAHVDFSSVAAKAKAMALAPLGPMPMGEFLLRLGLEARLRQLLARA